MRRGFPVGGQALVDLRARAALQADGQDQWLRLGGAGVVLLSCDWGWLRLGHAEVEGERAVVAVVGADGEEEELRFGFVCMVCRGADRSFSVCAVRWGVVHVPI